MDWTVWEYDSLTDLTMETMDTPTTTAEVTNNE